MASVLEKIKVATGIQEQETGSLLRQAANSVDDAITLTWKQRFIGFGCCVGAGILFAILSLVLLSMVNITGFAVTYSIGSILSICSTMFLMGPCKQVQRMFDEHRIIATVVYLAAIAGTLAIAFKTGNALLCLILIIVQLLALFWWVALPGSKVALPESKVALSGAGSIAAQ